MLEVKIQAGMINPWHRAPRSSTDDGAFNAEVSDPSLAGDRGQMARIYVGSGIPVYRIINLIDRQLEVYSSPVGGVYPPPTIIREPESVTLTPGKQPIGPIAVANLLP